MGFDFQAAYDELNAADDDYRFYVALADRLGAEHVVDLGCGTGVLATLMARPDRRVLGIDPDPGMLQVARTRPGADAVEWQRGDVTEMDAGWADLTVMSGHVSQVFLTHEQWTRTLESIRAGLRPGGVLAFEMRNPLARGWEKWTREATLRTVDTEDGPVEFWHETINISLPLVTYDTVSRNTRTGETRTTPDTLAFRDEPSLRIDLQGVGFTVMAVHGDWDGGAVSPASDELIFIATLDPARSHR